MHHWIIHFIFIMTTNSCNPHHHSASCTSAREYGSTCGMCPTMCAAESLYHISAGSGCLLIHFAHCVRCAVSVYSVNRLKPKLNETCLVVHKSAWGGWQLLMQWMLSVLWRWWWSALTIQHALPVPKSCQCHQWSQAGMYYWLTPEDT